MKLYNTLTRRKEDFIALDDNRVRMYSCGPTVYNYAHIGNMRTYIFMDILRRALILEGFEILGVMNITDVGHLLSDQDEGEDKMVLASREQKKSPYEIAEFYTGAFMKDLARLNIGKPELIVKATDHIGEMIGYVKALVDKGYAYETGDGIYYDISKFPEYGKLSGIKLEDQIAGSRVDVNEDKKHPADFALWKKAEKNHIMQWESPWGMGYPGWHIECSAMSRKYLGEYFDIHTGGVDHIPIHHENEIAQNEALTGSKCVNFWIHGEFMLVDNGKMSKSLKNTYNLDDLINMGYEPLDFRYFCLNAHYRKKLNFTFDGLDGAKSALKRLRALLDEHKNSSLKTSEEVINKYRTEFIDAVSDDLNVPLALGALWKMLKEQPSVDIYREALDMDSVFGLSLSREIKQSDEIPEEIRELAEERFSAKSDKDYKRSDALRELIKEKGYIIQDSKEGYTLKKL
ncbi:MAG: cysteine--tRNA ligase [Christensenellales bacterium]|jgi:cysteinyl-tRNA synthetase